VAHAQKPNFVFRRNGRVHLTRRGGATVQSTTGSRGVQVRWQCLYCAGEGMFRGRAGLGGYPLHSPVAPSLFLPRIAVCHVIFIVLYLAWTRRSITYTSHCLSCSVESFPCDSEACDHFDMARRSVPRVNITTSSRHTPRPRHGSFKASDGVSGARNWLVAWIFYCRQIMGSRNRIFEALDRTGQVWCYRISSFIFAWYFYCRVFISPL
jgi:hypothetical protein